MITCRTPPDALQLHARLRPYAMTCYIPRAPRFLQGTFDPKYQQYEEVVTKFYQEGVCVPTESGLTETQVDSVKEVVEVLACAQPCVCGIRSMFANCIRVREVFLWKRGL